MTLSTPAPGCLTVVGLGPGDEALVTEQVRASIAAATDAFGYFPYVERLAGMGHLQLHASDNREELERARQALDLAASGRRVLMLSSGDPGVFAMASAVFEV
ncbi:MAG: SAM-dependent methyltransferase, partial [Comamonas sp.]